MTLLQMKYFQTVASAKSICAAAEQLGISHTTLSITIARMEAELGYSLLEKQGRGVYLTAYGKKVLHYSNVILQSIEDIQKEFGEMQGVYDQNRIALGITDSDYSGEWILGFLQQYPEVELSLTQMSTEEIYNQLLAGSLDFGIINEVEKQPQLKSKLLFSLPYQLLVFKTHPFAQREAITLEELAKEPLISLPPSQRNRMIDKLCAETQIRPNIVFEGAPDIMREMFHSGIGSILTCSHNYRQWMKLSEDYYTLLNISGISARYETYLVWAKQRYQSRWVSLIKKWMFDYYHV